MGRRDVILVSGDAYVDHPASGPRRRALIEPRAPVAVLPSRTGGTTCATSESSGAAAVLWVTAGCMTRWSTATRAKNARSETPTRGRRDGFRPDYATTVYTRILKELYRSAGADRGSSKPAR